MSAISHISLNVYDLKRSTSFYLDALAPLGFRAADGDEDYQRITNGTNLVIVLSPVSDAMRPRGYHRKAIGLHHIAIAVEHRHEVDAFHEHLLAMGVEPRGGGPIDSDYRGGYYSVFFEDPDRILIEVVHHLPAYFDVELPERS